MPQQTLLTSTFATSAATLTEHENSRRGKRGIHSGRLRRPAICQLAIAPSVLANHGFKDQAEAHDEGMCARLYALGRRTAASGKP